MTDKILNAVITIVTKEEDAKSVKLTDHQGNKFKFWKRKNDGNLTAPAVQFKNMGLDEGSTVRIGYVIETFDWKGKKMESKKIINFQEAEQEADPELIKKPNFEVGRMNSPKPEPHYEEEKDKTFWDKKAYKQCLWNYWLQQYASKGLPLDKIGMGLVWGVFGQINKDAEDRFEITQEDILSAEEPREPIDDVPF